MNKIEELLRKKTWSPYWAGVGLGITGLLAILLVDKTLGASGFFKNFSGLVAQLISDKLANNFFYRFVSTPGISWQLWLLIGVFIGAFISAKFSGDFKFRLLADKQWKEIFGESVSKRWVYAFISGILIEYGAALAGGCTSGLAISGGLQFAPGAFVFIVGLFASGIATAFIIYGGRY